MIRCQKMSEQVHNSEEQSCNLKYLNANPSDTERATKNNIYLNNDDYL